MFKSARRCVMFPLIIAWLALGGSSVHAQPVPSDPVLSPGQEGPLQPDALAARKAEIQARLEALGEPDPEKRDQQEMRAVLEELLAALTALEEALQKRTTYLEQLEGLPRRLRELETEREQLEAREPRDFSEATEQLRSEYQAQLQATQEEIRELIRQTAAGEVRIANIPKELEQRNIERAQLEKDLLAARRVPPETDLDQLRVELLTVRLQLQDATIAALEAEHEWLIKRVPLQDALLDVAQLRSRNLQQDLDAIKQALGQAIEEEQASLSESAADIARRLEQNLDPAQALLLTVSLETVEIRRNTAEDRQQLNGLSDAVLEQERRNAQTKQTVDRLASLVEKYDSGEIIADRLLVIFERLQRERVQYRDTFVTQLEKRLRLLNERLFTLDDRLYEFDREAELQLGALTATLSDAMPGRREAAVAEVRALLTEQKAALRNQQQVLTALIQEMTKLLTLHREYKRQLDDSYVFALTQIFWLRDGAPLSWAVGRDMLAGATAAVTRLYAFVGVQQARLWDSLSSPVSFWFVMLLVFFGLPWGAYRARQYLRTVMISSLTAHAERDELPRGADAALIVFQSAIWPAYLLLVAWLYEHFFPQSTDQSDLAVVSSLQLSALILWVSLLGRGILRRKGWAQYYWGLAPELRRSLQRAVMGISVTALVCLVPRHILQTVPGAPDTATGSLALARLLFLIFLGVTFIVVGIVGRRGSPLMQRVLARSHQGYSFVWRLWPFLHIALLGVLLALMVLDMLGYRYAAQFLWLRALGSLAVVVVLLLLVVSVVPRLIRRLVEAVASSDQSPERAPGHPPPRSFTVLRILCNGLLIALAVGVLLEVWGLSVTWVITSPTVSFVLSRSLVVVVVVGLAALVIQASQASATYLLQPRTTQAGVTIEAGRKLKTLTPLVQTLIRIGVIFVAALVILEQAGINTGPVLAGVGIFGLAVGFASQSLIKDFINGLFILFEDSISVGDIVELRGIAGEVEKFTLRAVTLRDLSGNVHVIPNSSFDMVTNMTKIYSRYLLEVGVAYREDVDTVIAILKEIDEEMRADPDYGRVILQPIEILGLDRFEDSAVIIRARLTTRPIEQWRTAREFKRRMKKVFDQRGIEIPFPHRTVYWGQPKEGAQPPIEVAMTNHQEEDSMRMASATGGRLR